MQRAYEMSLQAYSNSTASGCESHEVPHANAYFEIRRSRGKSIDLEYLSFADAQVLLFTNKFQPSLESIILRVAAKTKKIIATKNIGASR